MNVSKIGEATMSIGWKVFGSFCLLSAFSCPVFAQRADLSGTVTDQTGAAIVGATVTATKIDQGLKREATTNDQGYFAISLLQPGIYSVTAQAGGFNPTEVPSVVLNVGDQKALQIQLRTGSISETVRVTGEASIINESSAVGTVVDRQFVENIPLNGRSFQSLITLTPGVVLVPTLNTSGTVQYSGQFSVNGQRAEANTFIVDGVSANVGATAMFGPGSHTSGNLPGLTVFGTTQSLASVDALQEFRVQTSSYSAEYGRQPGGQISILTRSGTNQFHGSIFDYFRNDVLDANDWFANQVGQPRAPMRQNDFGGTFGGPVRLPAYDGRDRTFFFFSYEGLQLREPQFTLTNVPSLALRKTVPGGLQPMLSAFPLPNGKDLGNGLAEFSVAYSNPSSLNATSIRIDHAATKRLNIFGRYNYAPSESLLRRRQNLSDGLLQRVPIQTVTLGATASLTERITSEFRFNYSDNKATFRDRQDNFGGSTPVDVNLLVPSQYSSPTAQGAILLLFPGRTAIAFPSLVVSPGDLIGDNVGPRRVHRPDVQCGS